MPEFGAVRLSELQRKDLQGYVDRLLVDGVHNPSTIRNTLVPLRVIFRRAVVRGEVAVNPTIGLEIPPSSSTRTSAVAPAEHRLDGLATHPGRRY
jgi:integrase